MALIDRFRLPKQEGTYKDRYEKLWQIDAAGKIWELIEIQSPSSRLSTATQRGPFARLTPLELDERVLLAELVAIHLDLIPDDDKEVLFWVDLRDKLLTGYEHREDRSLA